MEEKQEKGECGSELILFKCCLSWPEVSYEVWQLSDEAEPSRTTLILKLHLLKCNFIASKSTIKYKYNQLNPSKKKQKNMSLDM